MVLNTCMRPQIHIIEKSSLFLSEHLFPELSKCTVGLFSPKEMEVGWRQSSFLLLEAGREEGILADFPGCCFLVTLALLLGTGHTHLTAVCAQLLGCRVWSRFLPRSPRCLPVGTKVSAFSGTIQAYLFSRRHVLAAGGWVERRGQLDFRYTVLYYIILVTF